MFTVCNTTAYFMVANTVFQASCTSTFLRYMCHWFGIQFFHPFGSEKFMVTCGPFSGIDCSHFIVYWWIVSPPDEPEGAGDIEKTINWFGKCNFWDWHCFLKKKQTIKWWQSNLLKSFEVKLAWNFNGAKCFQVTPEIVLHVKDEHKHWSGLDSRHRQGPGIVTGLHWSYF